MPTLSEAACHESGHAVCALLLGRQYGARVFTTESGGGAGFAGPGELPTAPLLGEYDFAEVKTTGAGLSLREIVEDCTVYAAGSVATWMQRQDVLMGRPMEITTSDRRMLWAATAKAFGGCSIESQLAIEALAKARAEQLLGPVFSRVLAVAAELEKRGALTADEVCRTAFPEITKEATP